MCPTGAIKLSEEFELAVKFDKLVLIQRGELDVQYCTITCKAFSAKRLVKYSFECLVANVSQKRLEEAKNYLCMCPT